MDASDVMMLRSLIDDNETLADYGPGGGLYSEFSTVTLDECTIAKNASNGQPTLGGGITCWLASPAIEKSIIAFNDPGPALHCVGETSIPIVSCNDLYGNAGGDAICGTDAGLNFSLDPLFCDLAGNYFRLQMGSPCYSGNHPDGGSACQRDRIGAQDPGCNPQGVDEAALPRAGALWSRPNPLHPSTSIAFRVSRTGPLSLRIYDATSREVRILEDGVLPAGPHARVWDGRDGVGPVLPGGGYFARFSAGGEV